KLIHIQYNQSKATQGRFPIEAVVLAEIVKHGNAPAHLGLTRRATSRQAQGEGDLRSRVAAGLATKAACQEGSLVVQEGSIEHRQRWGRLRGAETDRRGAVGLGEVEALEDWRQERPLHVDVDAPAGRLRRT